MYMQDVKDFGISLQRPSAISLRHSPSHQ